MKHLTSQATISEGGYEVFSLEFNPTGDLLAIGGDDGIIRVHNPFTAVRKYELFTGSKDALGITGLCFRPETNDSTTTNVLLACGADGSVQHWHVPSEKCLSRITEPNNQVLCCDYKQDASLFATAGKDRVVRIYDEHTRELSQEMGKDRLLGDAGHGNRVFSLRFVPSDENLLVTGGWDNTIQVWDSRTGSSVRSIFGPHICGDSLDVTKDGKLLTGSWRPNDPLELWDLHKGTKLETIRFSRAADGPGTSIYSATFSRDEQQCLILAGGSGENCAKVFDRTSGNSVVGTIKHEGPIFATAMHEASLLAIGGSSSSIPVQRITSYAESGIDSKESGFLESKDNEFGTGEGVVGGSGFAAARARRNI
eukprot:gb/GECG01014390.1/.p1 GENE.gb/GECG01014390.1/~~gb/GECG01014390.1/.p1  ORF type:complete len:367 (+),score=38.38 gb/GECG01014390.1/:1-1101(+)